ncbi:F-box protein CPR1-like [Camellia sinensis]|uniref:F-box protein CPR1-like n=1 Tax=Camellia sinensis TaxID=4442 RepID=UPI001036DB14|nr:F-box protein CPR1-like [Camellia sinensis]
MEMSWPGTSECDSHYISPNPSQTLMEQALPELPPEVISEILSRLPVKPLLQFRCVSKPWCSLIDSPTFIKMHLHRSIQSRSNLSLIVTKLNSNIPNLLCSVHFDKLDIDFELYQPLTFEKRLDQVWNFCNGLLCLSFRNVEVVLSNPSTRKYLELPLLPIEIPVASCRMFVVFYGLGYDSVSDDYKVMRITQFNGAGFVHFESKVRVYSLKSDYWRKVGDFPHHLKLDPCTGLLVGGALHWSVNPKPMLVDGPRALIAFDLGSEEYRMVPLPECGAVDFHLKFAVLDGCLCVLHHYHKKGIDLWVMKEYGVKESWTKLIYIENSNVINCFAIYLEPLAYSKNGKKVLFQHNSQRFLWYNLERKTVEMVEIYGKPDVLETTVCLGSLVPLDGGRLDDSKDQATKDKKKKKVFRSYDFLSKRFKLLLQATVRRSKKVLRLDAGAMGE